MTQTATGKFTPQTDHAARATDLAAENQALRARMAYLLEQAERNHSIMTRHQAFDLEIVGAGNFPDLTYPRSVCTCTPRASAASSGVRKSRPAVAGRVPPHSPRVVPANSGSKIRP